MALREVCDVFGTTKALMRYRVLVEKEPVEVTDTTNAPGKGQVCDLHAVLCPRAFGRLIKKIKDGMSSPPPREPAEATKV